jgi:hypothetical protein
MIYKLSEAEKTVHDVKTLVDMGERWHLRSQNPDVGKRKQDVGRMIIFRSKEVRHG